jgi:hypothetical protein
MKTLTHDQEAFVQAYARIVAEAPEDAVRRYFTMEHDEFYKTEREYYTSITDAHLMWDAARQYKAEKTT